MPTTCAHFTGLLSEKAPSVPGTEVTAVSQINVVPDCMKRNRHQIIPTFLHKGEDLGCESMTGAQMSLRKWGVPSEEGA